MPTKWVQIDSSARPAHTVARQVLKARLGEVRTQLPLAAHAYQEDIEHVHQLRVACRRAGAALRAFAPLLAEQPSAVKKLKNSLRKIRRAAGPARDVDVLLARIADESVHEPAHRFLIERLRQHREEVQAGLIEAAAKGTRRQLRKRASAVLDTLTSDDHFGAEVAIGKYAHDALQSALQGVLDLAHLDESTPERLHELRIACKRLRYSIEIFHNVLPDELREELYPQLVEVQDRLGRLNDHATAQKLFQTWMAELPASALAAELAQRVVGQYEAGRSGRDDFLDWWTAERIATIENLLRENPGVAGSG